MKMFKQIVGLAIAFLMTASVFAQREFRDEADYAYDSHNFYKAIDLYKKALTKCKTKQCKAEINFFIAECYRFLRQPAQEEVFYAKAIKMRYDQPMMYFHLGLAKKALGKFDEATVEFNNFLSESPSDEDAKQRAKDEVECCKMIKDWKNNPTRYTVQNMALINSQQGDFSPSYMGDPKKLLFTSTREGSSGTQDIGTGHYYSAIYETMMDQNGKWSTPSLLPEPLNSNHNDGQPVIDNKGKTMYFTRCREEKKEIISCKIYKAKKRGKNFEEPELLPFGNDSVHILHPTLSADEKVMYFAADMDGGIGGFDIWKSEYDGKAWGAPVNLGEPINTIGNEQFPFIRDNGSLYFSSDHHCGMGGLDIFEAKPKGDNFEAPENMKFPLNSERDDFAMVWERDPEGKDINRGYFTSNREGGKGDDDIYSFVLPPLQFIVQCNMVRDKNTGKALGGVKVEMIGSDGSSIQTMTDENGKYELKLAPKTSYEFTFCKQYYYTEKRKLTTVGLNASASLELCVEMEDTRKEIVLPGVEYDLDQATLRPTSKKVLDNFLPVLTTNPTLVIELSSHTDYRGSDTYNARLSQARAQSVVDYLVGKGIHRERLVPKGYGESKPREVPPIPDGGKENWKRNWKYDYKSGDVLTPKYIDGKYKKKSDGWEDAMQKNRRTEFSVLRNDFVPPGGLPKSDTGCQ